MKSLKIGDLTVKTPIIQGGMGIGVSLSKLAAAVANEGGIGVISSVGIGMTEPNYKRNIKKSNELVLRQEISRAIKYSKGAGGAIGVNIMMALTDYEDLLNISISENADVVFIGAGLPLNMPKGLKDSKTKFIPKVSSPRAAKIIFNHWMNKYGVVPDAVAVEGHLCGGHIGFKKNDIINNTAKSLSSLVKKTAKEMDVFEQKLGIEIPIIAAGGIYSGADVYNIMKDGAKAVKMGTRFVTTTECDVAKEFKMNYINCKKEDIVIIDSPVGLPGRVIANDYIKEIQQGQQKPINCSWKCLKYCDFRKVKFCIAEALLNAARGDFKNGFSFAGTNAYRNKEIISVKETIRQITQEFNSEKALQDLKN